jgi:hypothetical protein
MRYLCVYKAEERNTPPSQEEFVAMGALIEEMNRAGVLLATNGCAPSAKGFRVRVDSGKFTVTDGPFPETKELLCGYCLMEVKSKAEAVEWTKRFLNVVGRGESEVRLIFEGDPTAA